MHLRLCVRQSYHSSPKHFRPSHPPSFPSFHSARNSINDGVSSQTNKFAQPSSTGLSMGRWRLPYVLTRSKHAPQRNMPIAILQTCHAAYPEAIPTLYTDNIFSLSSMIPSAPLDLIYFHDYIVPPTHFENIRHLRMRWIHHVQAGSWSLPNHAPYDFATWARFWDIVSAMKLTSLGVYITVTLGNEDRAKNCSDEADWLREMMNVSGVTYVDVKIEGMAPPANHDRYFEKIIVERWVEGSSRKMLQ